MKNPLISVILVIQNNEDYLKDSIKSLKKQTFRKFEVIAVDDASSDKSWEILRKSKGKDKRFRIYKNKARYGLRISLARAIKKAKTPYITFMDPVSINYQKRLDYQIRFMENNPGVAAIGSQAKYIDHKNKIIQKSSFPLNTSDIVKNLILGTTFEPSTLMINKTLLPKDIFKLQSSKPEFVYINLMLQISRYGKLLNLEKPLVYIKKVSKTNKLYSDFERFLEHIKLFIKSMETAGEKPTLKAFFSPLLPEI